MIRVIEEMRVSTHGEYPKYVCWENVLGALSSNKYEDFRLVLESFCQLADKTVSIPMPKKWERAGCIVGDGYSLAWRVYDAQHWGVPQRRKRVYLVLSLGNERAGEVLFEPESCGWHSQTCGEARKETACTLSSNVAGLEPTIVYDARGNGNGKIVPTLTGDHQNRVTDYTALCVGNGQMCNITMAPVSNTLDCMHDQQAVLLEGKPPRKYIVRRLTPLECCRLQGFPDNYLDGVDGSDTAKYKLWGNGIALPCAYDVLRKVAADFTCMIQ